MGCHHNSQSTFMFLCQASKTSVVMPKTLQFPCTYSSNWNIWKKNSLYHYLEIPFPASFSNFYFWQIENLFSKVLVMESINLQICSRIFENKISWENFWEFWTLIVNALWHVSDSKGLLDSLGLYWIALL